MTGYCGNVALNFKKGHLVNQSQEPPIGSQGHWTTGSEIDWDHPNFKEGARKATRAVRPQICRDSCGARLGFPCEAGQTGATGDRLKEGSMINKSLSALGAWLPTSIPPVSTRFGW